MPLTTQQDGFLKTVFQKLIDRPLNPSDPLYEQLYVPLYENLERRDPVKLLMRTIDLSPSESRQFFSGFRGSGKSTQLLRLKKELEALNYRVYYANALDYLNPALPVDITHLLICLAGAFSDSVEKEEKIDILGESYWTRFWQYLNNTQVQLKGFDLSLFSDAAKLQAALKEVPSFRQQIQEAMSNSPSEFDRHVKKFFEECRVALDKKHEGNAGVVFLFDNLEQISGIALSEVQEVLASIEKIFSKHLDRLSIPYIHLVYSTPPWLRFALPGMDLEILPSIVQWRNDPAHTPNTSGDQCLLEVVSGRLGNDGFRDFFASEEDALYLVRHCGGSLRDLIFLLRQTVLNTDCLPITRKTIESAVSRLRESLILLSTEDALWLAKIAERRRPELPDNSAKSIFRFTWFVNQHLVLFLRNGEEWYDVHPLIRERVAEIAASEAEKITKREAEKASSE